MFKSLHRYFQKLVPKSPTDLLLKALPTKAAPTQSLEGQFADLDAALRIQNLRRREEEHLERLYWGMGVHRW